MDLAQIKKDFHSKEYDIEDVLKDIIKPVGDEIKTIRENEFVNHFLPLFSMSPDEQDKYTEQTNISFAHWQAYVSKGNYPVQVIAADGSVVAVVPPFTNTSGHHFDETVKERVLVEDIGLTNRIPAVFQYAKQIKDNYPKLADDLTWEVLFEKLHHQQGDSSAHDKAWYKLFLHYGLVKGNNAGSDKSMDSSGSSIINSSEKIEMKAPSDFDFEEIE